ncbi:MAG: hypothetical protein AAF401_04110 [Pseudomonadota bacterium]
MTGVKMITCCYCGARDMMQMGKGKRVTLTCLSCGAPIRKVEMIKASEAPRGDAKAPERINKHRKGKHFEAYKKRKKGKKSFFSRILDDADDIFDLDDLFDFD